MRMPSAVRTFRLVCGSRRFRPTQPEPAQVVGHLAVGVDAAEQSSDQDAEVLAGKAGRGEQRLAQGAGQGHDPRIAESKSRVPPPLRVDGGVCDPLKGWARKDGVLAGTFGSSREANPLDSPVNPSPARLACRLTHSCPLAQALAGYGKLASAQPSTCTT
jgi:hypothetical protein